MSTSTEMWAGDPEYKRMLDRLAERRAQRMASGRPVFDLTAEEIEASVRTAMRLAGADVAESDQKGRGSE